MRKLLCLLAGMLLLVNSTLFAQQREVTGKVTDANGAPINGASIRIKNSRTGTSAGLDGNFKIMAAPNAVLAISAVGYESQDLKLGSETNISVKLAIDTRAMAEVVVTGTGVATTKKKLAISVESVNMANQVKVPTGDVGQQLVGQIAGAQISSVSGSPGSGPNILLRGINSVRAGTFPMILLDGIEVRATSLESIDLNNVERVEVVQGAAAASIYGAQGANGVIQIFSKKGKLGKINIDVSSSIATNELLNIGKVNKAKTHAFNTNANGEVIGGSGNPLVFDPNLSHYEENVIVNLIAAGSIANKQYDKNLKWYDHYAMFFQKATTYNNAITISGAREKIDFSVSASNTRQESVFKNNGKYQRSNLVSNVGIELFKNLKFRSSTQLVYTDNTQLDQTGRTIVYALNNSRPFANYDYIGPDGNYGAYFGDATGVNGYNFNYTSQYSDVKDEKIDVIQNFNLNYKFPKFVELDAKYGINHQNNKIVTNIADQSGNLNADYWQYWTEYYFPGLSYGAPTTKDESGEINTQQFTTTFQNFLSTATIRTDFAKDFGLKIPLRTTTQVAFDYRKNVFKQYNTYGVDAPSYTPYTATQMSTYRIAVDFTQPFVTYGYLLNHRFEWGEIAGVSGGFRSDFSSAFGRGSEPFTFPRGDAYVRISELGFWKDGKLGSVIPELKFRGAFGKAGIQPGAFDRYVVLGTRNLGNSNSFVFPTQNPNPDLDVEVSRETEIGADMTFNVLKKDWLKSITLSATYWDRKTDNAIWPTDAAPSTGTGTILDNAFGLGSNGFQASLNMNMLSNRKINWNFITNFSKQSSKITSVSGTEVVVQSNAGSSNYVLKAGEKIGQLYGFLLLNSVDQKDPNGNLLIPQADHGLYEVASNGWVVNKTTRQPYASAGQFSFGDPNPKFNMAFINDVSYGGFLNFSMQWDWIYKSHLYNQTKEWMYRDGIHKDYEKPISINGQTEAFTAFYRGVYAVRSFNGTKNYFYEDATFLRLRNLSVGVDVNKFLKLKALNKMQLVFSGRNLITITDYTGYDPEISSGRSNSAFDRGVDHNSIPNVKTYQIGLNIGF